MAILFIKDLYKSYGSKLVLENIDLAMSPGEFCSLVGPSGCGKSTLFRLILGEEKFDSGLLLIDGLAAGVPDPRRGIVYQKYMLYPHLAVLENVLLGKKLSSGFWEWHKRKKEFRDEAMYYLKRAHLEEHYNKYPHELSGGMQQRVACIQAVIMRPKILMMDEPFGALDTEVRRDMQKFLLELWQEFQMTIIFVTHDLEEAVFMATRILVLSQFYTDDRGEGVSRGSRIVVDYPMRDIKGEPPHDIKSISVKFDGFLEQIRKEGFEPSYRQHVKTFTLKHHDSFQTLTDEESRHH